MFWLGLMLGVLLGFLACSLMVISGRQSRYEEDLADRIERGEE